MEDFDVNNIFLAETSYENILIFDVSYKSLVGAKPLDIMCNKVDGFVRNYRGTKYLVLFGTEMAYDAIFDRIRYFIGLKSSITYFFLIILQKSKLIKIMICL